MNYFRPFWNRFFAFNWQFGMLLILLFGIPRFLVVLKANETGNYNFTSIIFVIMWLIPFILLNKAGRITIGIKKPKNYPWLLYAFILGVLACTVVFLLGTWLYGTSLNNWLVYISKSYQGSLPSNFEEAKQLYFISFAVVSMIFSPIGEELLYRGMIHESFVQKFGEQRASMLDSAAFALTHLAHFGLLYTAGGWEFRWLPALLWVLLMFFTSRIFFYCRQKAVSVYAAILSHAGFNLAMTYFIFYHIF